MTQKISKDIVFLYHVECPDGFGAAWAAYKKFGDLADYLGVEHGEPPPAGLKDKEIYLLDFSYDELETAKIIANNKRLTTIDHHVTREAAIKMTHDYRFSLNNSGSVLAWKYFHNEKEVPKLLQYIEDRDLWRHVFPETDKLCAYIDSFDFDFKQWNKLASDFEDKKLLLEFNRRGDIILTHDMQLMKDIIRDAAKMVIFNGLEVYCINAPYFFADHVGKILYTQKPPLAIIWGEDKNSVHVSLRSDGTADVGEIAKKFGGGGHKGSAGFDLPSLELFPWKEKVIKALND